MGAFDILNFPVTDSTEFGDFDAMCWQTKDLARCQHVYEVIDERLYIIQRRELGKPLKFLGEFTGVVEVAHSEANNNASYALCFQNGILKEVYRTFSWCLVPEGKSKYPLCVDMEKLEAKYPNNGKDE